MNDLQFNLFGKFQIVSSTSAVIEIDVQKAKELLCYLLVFRHKPHSREVIAEVLWKDNSSDQARSYLRRTLWQLQHILKYPTSHPGESLLIVDQEWLQVNPYTTSWIDVDIFEKTYEVVRGIPGEDLSNQTVNMLKIAINLHHSNLLEGWYQDWCIYERERLQYLYLVMLDKLMRYCEVHDQFEEGIEYGLRILRQDRSRECTHRQLMRLYYLARDRNAAIRQYERCVHFLQLDLGVQPTQRTRRLYEKIKSGIRTEFQDVEPTVRHVLTVNQSTLEELISRLRVARDEAKTLGNQLDLQIEIVQKLMSK